MTKNAQGKDFYNQCGEALDALIKIPVPAFLDDKLD